MREFRENISINKWSEILTNSGRRYFALNLLFVSFLDMLKGTDFGGRLMQEEIGTTADRANDYSATPRCLIKTLKTLNITSKDTILDMGCGKGLAMYYMSSFPFKMIGGVELSKKLAEAAKKNLKKIKPKEISRFNIVNQDAGKWDNYDDYNFYYIYNSFPKQVMKEIMIKINQSIEHKPRKVLILYLYPEFTVEIRKTNKFILLKKGKKKEIREGMHIYINREFSKERVFK